MPTTTSPGTIWYRGSFFAQTVSRVKYNPLQYPIWHLVPDSDGVGAWDVRLRPSVIRQATKELMSHGQESFEWLGSD